MNIPRLSHLLLSLALLLSGASHAAEKIDINHADAITIADGLSGIGPGKAKAIVAWRDAHGPFKQWSDLLEVKGIGEAAIARNRGRIELGAEAPPATSGHHGKRSRIQRESGEEATAAGE